MSYIALLIELIINKLKRRLRTVFKVCSLPIIWDIGCRILKNSTYLAPFYM
jgi:hypothetical protein